MNKLEIVYFPELSYAADEAVNTLCTNLTFSGANVRKIMLTSCHSTEGKSFLSMNIMRTMAKLGYRVAMVDADLRRSMVTERYQLLFPEHSKKFGLSHYLAGKAEMTDVVYETNLSNTYFVPVGRNVSNALPLLNSPRFEELLNFLASQVDYVFVDAAPVGTVIDAAEIAKSCDGTLLIVTYNSVRRQELLDVKTQLEQTKCPILGTVLNMVEFDGYLSKKYYYKSYYSNYEYYGKSDDKKEDKKEHGKKKQ